MVSTWFVMAAALAVGGDAAAAEGNSAPKTEQRSEASSGPGGFAQWWFGGQYAIYDNSGFLGLSWTYGRFNGGELEAKGINDKAPQSTGIGGSASSTWTQGLSLEVGSASNVFGLGQHVGLLAFGLNAFWTDNTWTLLYANPLDNQNVSLYGGSLRFFQPRARYVFGRLDLSAQVGPALHIGVVNGEGSALRNTGGAPVPGAADTLLDTSAFAGLGLEGQASLRFYPLDMLYVEGAYRHSFQIVDFVGAIGGMHDWHMGLGLIY